GPTPASPPCEPDDELLELDELLDVEEALDVDVPLEPLDVEVPPDVDPLEPEPLDVESPGGEPLDEEVEAAPAAVELHGHGPVPPAPPHAQSTPSAAKKAATLRIRPFYAAGLALLPFCARTSSWSMREQAEKATYGEPPGHHS